MTGVALDLTITFGNIIEIGVIAVGGISALAVMKTTVGLLKQEIADSKQEASEAFAEMKQDTKAQFADVQSELKKIGDVLVNQADQNRRIIHLENDVRDLRHGRGFVRGPAGIDKEFP